MDLADSRDRSSLETHRVLRLRREVVARFASNDNRNDRLFEFAQFGRSDRSRSIYYYEITRGSRVDTARWEFRQINGRYLRTRRICSDIEDRDACNKRQRIHFVHAYRAMLCIQPRLESHD